MSIDYTGHCRLTIPEAQRRIDFMRKTRPDWYGGMFALTDATGLWPFGLEIARQFGMEAKSRFNLFLLNKDWLEESREAVEYTYSVFGTNDLVITYGNDSIRPPLAEYPPMAIG